MPTQTPFDHLAKHFARLPGLGPRSAKRITLHLLTQGRNALEEMAESLKDTATQMKVCNTCGNLDLTDTCKICTDPRRQQNLLCVVAGIGDLWAIERTGSYHGRYHVLGGVLSALDGITPDKLRLNQLEQRLESEEISELILALSATVDGQTTAHYVSDLIHRHHNRIKITRLAHGMPVGGELDYLDDGTIMTAFKARKSLGN